MFFQLGIGKCASQTEEVVEKKENFPKHFLVFFLGFISPLCFALHAVSMWKECSWLSSILSVRTGPPLGSASRDK